MDEAYHIRCYGTSISNGYAEGPNRFTILTDTSHDVTQLRIGFEGPSEPEVKCVTLENNNVNVTFVPGLGGDYKIHILYKGVPIFASPFKSKIVGNVAHGVKTISCSGDLEIGIVNKENVVVLDGRKVRIAGGISARLTGPSEPILNFSHNLDGTASLSYKVTSPGIYRLFLKFQQYSIPGSPFTINCIREKDKVKLS